MRRLRIKAAVSFVVVLLCSGCEGRHVTEWSDIELMKKGGGSVTLSCPSYYGRPSGSYVKYCFIAK